MTDDPLDLVTPLASTPTPHYAIPYPASSDPVSAGAANMQAIAEQTERALGWIASQTLAADAASLVFSSIPATYLDLILLVWAKGTGSTSGPSLQFRCNGDSGASAYNTNNTASGAFNSTGAGGNIGDARDPAAAWWCHEPNVCGYTDITRNRALSLLGRGGNYPAWTGNPSLGAAGCWNNVAAAVNSLTVLSSVGNLKAGTLARLYGRM